MTGYAIITQQHYSQLLKNNVDYLTENKLLQQSNKALTE